ncbi:MAG: GtrA family protein [Clostridia bacterium]|nr:GtrA family protein [Clostridia bacterium]
MYWIKTVLKKYKELILYGFWGVMTTLVNYVVYFVCLRFLSINYLISNVVSWICAVTFAYITNKIFVFNSKDWSPGKIKGEVIQFFLGRLLSLVVETVMLYVLVDGLSFSSEIMKVLTNLVVIAINYFISKFMIFK